MTKRYDELGVSAQKGDVHVAIAGLSQGLFPGAFCKLLPDYLTGSKEHCILMHADGAGTKASAAYVAWREYQLSVNQMRWGDKIWDWLAQDAMTMNVDDAVCVGALGPLVVSNSLERNTYRIPGEVIKAVILGYEKMCNLLTNNGIECYLAGGETADTPDLTRTLALNCTIVTRMRREDVIDCGRMQPGDVIVGFSSMGQAKWENFPNSGIGSNGLTLARHILISNDLARAYPESLAPENDPKKVYLGAYRHNQFFTRELGELDLGELLLSPTRTYAPLVKLMLQSIPREQIHGLIHCSGGGQTKIRKFGGPGLHFFKDNPMPVPPFLGHIQKMGRISWKEMYEVFNMGWRLEAVVPNRTVAQNCIDVATVCGIHAQVVGSVENSNNENGNNTITIKNPIDGRLMVY